MPRLPCRTCRPQKADKPGRVAGHAVRYGFEAFGDPSVLELARVATPPADGTRALVRVMAASINPSGVKKLAGAMKQPTLPRIPGRDFAGVVEAGPAEGSLRKVATGSAGRIARRPQE